MKNTNTHVNTLMEWLSTFIIAGNPGKPGAWGLLLDTMENEDKESRSQAYFLGTPPWNDQIGLLGYVDNFGTVDVDQENPFFSFVKGDWTHSPIAKPNSQAWMRAYRSCIDMGADFILPTGTMLNWMNKLYPSKEKRGKVRLVIKANKGDAERAAGWALATFDGSGVADQTDPNVEWTLKPWVIDDRHSTISRREIQSGKRYWVEPVSEDDDSIYVGVRKRFSVGVSMGLHEAEHGWYVKDHAERTENFAKYPSTHVKDIPLLARTSLNFPSVHCDASFIYDAMMVLSKYKRIHLGIGKVDAAKAAERLDIPPLQYPWIILLEGIPAEPTDPVISMYIATYFKDISGNPN